MKALQEGLPRAVKVVAGVVLATATAASAQTPATISVTCPVSVLNNTTYNAEVKINVGSGAPCQPPGQPAMMCGLGAYNLQLTYNTARVNLIPASPDLPLEGGTAAGFGSVPAPPNCSANCQQPVTDPQTFLSGSVPVSAFNTNNGFGVPVGQASVLKATFQAVGLGSASVGVTADPLQVVDTTGAPFSVTTIGACSTSVSQYACLGDVSQNGFVSVAEAQRAVKNVNKAVNPSDLTLNANADGDGNGFVSAAEGQRVVKNTNKVDCIP